MEWIDVKDKLPPLNEFVYVYGFLDEFTGWGVGMAYLEKTGNEYTWRTEDSYWYNEVRRWLEMPPIPPVPQRFKDFNKI